MKKIIKILFTTTVVFVLTFVIVNYFSKTHYKVEIQMKDNNLSYDLKYSRLKGAVDFTKDEKQNYYIAYSNRIQIIKDSGKSYDILKNSNLNIHSMDYYKGNLYYSSGDSIYCYNMNEGKNTILIKGLPNYGDYKDSLVKVSNACLYISIGSATNSGVVGDDNKWVNGNLYAHDMSPENITLRGINFGKSKTGAFQSYNTKSIKGQIVPAHFPGNACIIIYNLESGTSDTFAWGIRNVTGMGFTDSSKLICAVGGMENRGSRPVIGDTDYIYEVKKGRWYGWPDYSGGDPVTSPKFKSVKNSPLQFILDNHPTTNPQAPIYQHKTVSSIGTLAVDSKGDLNDRNCIFFYDNIDNIVYSFRGTGLPEEKVKFSERTKISSIKIYDKSLLLLDGKEGYLYSIKRGKIKKVSEINKNIYPYILMTTVLGIILILKVQGR
ncbi:hypothetical protein [Clostridium sp. 001]|uniref:hypothetical protein n=1 Tax=Clostridium sp. 001 TaxID=1970093 RepID=UPI001C2C9C63|nr:hypothetical protein [Clostridium sp. 001]QXE17523.1 hypothetical protein B5S50_00920 [Clostridium sp. 001]